MNRDRVVEIVQKLGEGSATKEEFEELVEFVNANQGAVQRVGTALEVLEQIKQLPGVTDEHRAAIASLEEGFLVMDTMIFVSIALGAMTSQQEEGK